MSVCVKNKNFPILLLACVLLIVFSLSSTPVAAQQGRRVQLTVTVQVIDTDGRGGRNDAQITVLDPNGRPVPRAQVRIDNRSRFITNSRGITVAANQRPGTHNVSAYGRVGRQVGMGSAQFTVEKQQRAQFQVTATVLDGDRDGLQNDVRVNVRDANGKPAATQLIVDNKAAGSTDAKGNGVLRNQPPGSHRLIARSRAGQGMTEFSVGKPPDITMDITTRLGDNDGQGGRNDVQVTISFSNRNVRQEASITVGGRTVGSTRSRRLYLPNLPQGSHDIQATATVYGKAVTAKTSVAIEAPPSIAVSALVQDSDGKGGQNDVAVTVAFNNGNPVPGATINLSGKAVGRSGDDGTFSMLNLSPASYRIIAAYTYGRTTLQSETAVKIELPKITVTAMVTDSDGKGGRNDLQITVMDSNSKLVPSALIQVNRRNVGATNSQGVLVFANLVPGTYTINAQRQYGRATSRGETSITLEAPAVQGTSPIQQQSTGDGLNLATMLKATDADRWRNDLSVTVTDTSGKGVPRANISIGRIRGRTDSVGKFLYRNLRPGDHRIYAVAMIDGKRLSAESSVTVAPREEDRKAQAEDQASQQIKKILANLYKKHLQREPSTQELNNYTPKLVQRTMTPQQVEQEILNSPEYKKKQAAKEQKRKAAERKIAQQKNLQAAIKKLYQKNLNREPKPNELQHYTGQVLQRVMTISQVEQAIQNSAEYKQQQVRKEQGKKKSAQDQEGAAEQQKSAEPGITVSALVQDSDGHGGQNDIQVTVMDNNGSPVPKAAIRLNNRSGGNTDAKGALTIANQNPGKYAIMAYGRVGRQTVKDGTSIVLEAPTQQQQAQQKPQQRPSQKPSQQQPGGRPPQTAERKTAAEPGITVSALVQDNDKKGGLNDLQITAMNQLGRPVPKATIRVANRSAGQTDSQGVLRYNNLTPGTHRVGAYARIGRTTVKGNTTATILSPQQQRQQQIAERKKADEKRKEETRKKQEEQAKVRAQRQEEARKKQEEQRKAEEEKRRQAVEEQRKKAAEASISVSAMLQAMDGDRVRNDVIISVTDNNGKAVPGADLVIMRRRYKTDPNGKYVFRNLRLGKQTITANAVIARKRFQASTDVEVLSPQQEKAAQRQKAAQRPIKNALAQLYKKHLDRAPTTQELNKYVPQILKRTMTPQQVEQEILSSSEYKRKQGEERRKADEQRREEARKRAEAARQAQAGKQPTLPDTAAGVPGGDTMPPVVVLSPITTVDIDGQILITSPPEGVPIYEPGTQKVEGTVVGAVSGQKADVYLNGGRISTVDVSSGSFSTTVNLTKDLKEHAVEMKSVIPAATSVTVTGSITDNKGPLSYTLMVNGTVVLQKKTSQTNVTINQQVNINKGALNIIVLTARDERNTAAAKLEYEAPADKTISQKHTIQMDREPPIIVNIFPQSGDTIDENFPQFEPTSTTSGTMGISGTIIDINADTTTGYVDVEVNGRTDYRFKIEGSGSFSGSIVVNSGTNTIVEKTKDKCDNEVTVTKKVTVDMTKSTLYGRVLDSESGKGVEGAMIQAIGISGVYQGRSGSDGRFTIRDLPNGNYTVLIDRDDYLQTVETSVTVPNYGPVSTEVTPTSVNVNMGH